LKTVVVEERAESEIKQAFFWYLERKESVALSFYESIATTLNTIVASPKIGNPLNNRLRKFPLGKFPYNVIYREDLQIIYIIALAHQKRKPEH
jgi:plasmid stabilization system protein ParE